MSKAAVRSGITEKDWRELVKEIRDRNFSGSSKPVTRERSDFDRVVEEQRRKIEDLERNNDTLRNVIAKLADENEDLKKQIFELHEERNQSPEDEFRRRLNRMEERMANAEELLQELHPHNPT